MDQDTAKKLFFNGAFLVALDVPQNTEIGIDCNCWRTGVNFMGIKMIPPGLHFIYHSAVNGSGQVAPRIGFFRFIDKQEVLVYRWDVVNEDLTTDGIATEIVERIASNIKDLDRQLGAYPFESLKSWLSLTKHITDPLVKKLQPGSVMFTAVPKPQHPQGSSASEITHHHMDQSYTLSLLLSRCYESKDDDLLGEIQFAFIHFLIGHSYEAFVQWKKLVILLCSCNEAIIEHADLYNNFISVLHFQLDYSPDDLFVDPLLENNFLVTVLKNFFDNLEDSLRVSKDLVRKGLQFRDYLAKKYSWDFSCEINEFAPTVVS